MTSSQSALLLIGSAKPAGESTSESLGAGLLQRLAGRGFITETRYVARAMRTPDRTRELLQTVDRAGLFILAFPLYVDSLPHLVTQALERIADHRQAQPSPAPASFLAIANCGFPEPHQDRTALEICEHFAGQAGFTWAGGLALGAGGAIAGRPLARLGGMVHNVAAALDMAASDLSAGGPLSEGALELMARPILPPKAYILMGDLGWLVQARRNHALTRILARPFKPVD